MSATEKRVLDRLYLRLIIAAVIVVAAFLLRHSLEPYLGNTAPFITFYPAVMVVATLAGFWPGVLATAMASLLADYWIFQPRGHFAIASTADTVALTFFAGMGVFMSTAAEGYRRNQRQTATLKRELALRESTKKLQQSEEQFETLANAIPQLCWMANPDGWIFWYNQRWYSYTGTTAQQMEGWGWQSVHDPETLPKVVDQWKASIATGDPFDMVFPLRGSNGVFRPFLTRVMPVKDAEGKVVRWFGTNTDISVQKQAEEELRKSNARLDLAVEVADLGEWELDLIDHTSSRSLRHDQIFGYQELLPEWTYEMFLDHVLPQHRAAVDKKFQASRGSGTWDFETQIKRTDGEVRWIWARGRSQRDEMGQPMRMAGTVMDITGRKQAEEQFQNLNRTLKALNNSNQALLHTSTEPALLQQVCRIITADCSYAMVWIGIAENDEDKTVRPVAHAGFEEGYLETLRITWGDGDRGRGPTGTAIRTGQASICRNMLTDPAFLPWRDEAIERGYASSLVLPLIEGDKAFGAITIYAQEPNAFADSEVELLTELAADLAHGIATLRLRAAHAQADRALRSSQARLQGIVGSAMDAVISVDMQQRIVVFNRAAETVFQCAASEALGTTLERFIPTTAREAHREHIRKYGNEGITSRSMTSPATLTGLRRNGEEFPVEATISQVEVDGEKLYTVILRDITERKQAESVLQTTLQRFYAILSNMYFGILLVTDEGRIEFVNQAFCDLFSLEEAPADLVGNDPGEMIERIKNAYRSPIEAVARIREVLDGKKPVIGEELDMRGGRILIRDFVPLNVAGKSYGRLWIHADITERKQAEDALRASEARWATTLQSIGDAVISTDASGRVEFMNEVAQRLTEWPLPEAKGQDLSDIFNIVHEVTRLKPESPVAKVIRLGKTIGLANHTVLIGRDGTEVPVDDSAAPIRDSNGRIEGVVLVFHDVSEQRRAEKALRDSDRLTTTGKLAATIAHEIHNPLDSVGNLLYLIGQGTQEDSTREFVTMAAQELVRITQLTQQMLTFQREAAKPVPVKIGQILDNVIALYERKIKSSGINLEQQVDFDGDILALPGELRQMFANLLGNAIEAVGSRRGTITLRAHSSQDWRNQRLGLRVVVADDGPGIPADVRTKIFEPFFTTKGEKGTGLGLWITSDIIRKYEGTMRLRTRTEPSCSGTCFSVFLPFETSPGSPARCCLESE